MAFDVNGAESLIETLEHNGIEVCFANPGTSEMHFVAALDRSTRIKGVLALFEGVATSAADGYSRMLDKPAATLLHLGPGMANGLSGLHNALRARASMVNIVGDHASYHRALDAPLTSDIEGAARPFCHWVRTSPAANTIAADAADAIGNSLQGRISTLILPADTAWNIADQYTEPPKAVKPPAIALNSDVIEAAARNLLSNGKNTAVLLGGRALRQQQIELAAKICASTGATLLSETFAARTQRGAGRYTTQKIPYPVGASQDLLANYNAVILIDAKQPVAFFAYPDKSSVLTAPGTTFFTVAPQESDSLLALDHLYDAVVRSRMVPSEIKPAPLEPEACPQGAITPEKLAAWLSGAIPENAIVLDESITMGRSIYTSTMRSQPHDYFSGTGGAIGWAFPVAAGAAIACPDRKVIALESDGSGMYMPQSLWTYAREELDITVLILSNRKYQILHNEMGNVGVHNFGDKARSLLDLDQPNIDWVSLSRGLGVPADYVETIEDLQKIFTAACASPGPYLIEIAC